MQPNYKVEEVRPKHNRFNELFLPVALVVMTLAGVSVISAISYFFGVEQGKIQKTPFPLAMQSVTPTAKPISSTPTPSASTSKKPTSPTPTPLPKTMILTSDKALDGFVSSNGYTSSTAEVRAGRNKFLVSRGFLSFDLEKLPQYTKIVSATLRVYQIKTTGNPYTSETGNLAIDHLNYGDTLEEKDYQSPALASNFTDLSKNKTVGWKEVEVSSRLLEDLGSNKKVSQFRLHFEKEEKGLTDSGDYAYFESSDNSEGTTNVPQLLVKYY